MKKKEWELFPLASVLFPTQASPCICTALTLSPGVYWFPGPRSLACTATIISKSIFCQAPVTPTKSWGGKRPVLPGHLAPLCFSLDWASVRGRNLEWFLDTMLRFPASLMFHSIIVSTSHIHLASDGSSAFKSHSFRVYSWQNGPIFTVDVPAWNNGPWAVTLLDGSCQSLDWQAEPLFTYWLRLKNHLWSLQGGSFRNGTRNVKCHCLTSSVPQLCFVFYCLFSSILSAVGLSQLSELNERKGITCKGHILRNGWPFSYLNFLTPYIWNSHVMNKI